MENYKKVKHGKFLARRSTRCMELALSVWIKVERHLTNALEQWKQITNLVINLFFSKNQNVKNLFRINLSFFIIKLIEDFGFIIFCYHFKKIISSKAGLFFKNV